MQGWAGLNNTFEVVLIDILGSPYQGSAEVPLEASITLADQPAASSQTGSASAAAGAAGADQPLAAAVLDISRQAQTRRVQVLVLGFSI